MSGGVRCTVGAWNLVDKSPLLATGAEVRALCRATLWGSLKEQTSGFAPGYAQANLVILPAEHAAHFKAYCDANPKPCPLLVSFVANVRLFDEGCSV